MTISPTSRRRVATRDGRTSVGTAGVATALWIGLLAIGVLSTARRGPSPLFGGDSPLYLPPAGARFSLVSLIGNRSRPWVITLPFALAGNPQRIVALQQITSFGAWATVLWAAGRTRLRMVATQIVRAGVLVLALSAPVAHWNHVLQSESISISAAGVFSAGLLLCLPSTRPNLVGPFLAFVGFGVAGLVRPPLALVLVPLALGLAVPWWRSRRPPALRRLVVVVSALALASLAVVVVNERMNIAWGKEFSGVDHLRGRSMQQVQVLATLPWGRRLVEDRLAELSPQSDCAARGIRAPRYWPEIAMECPDSVRSVADGFEITLFVELARHPTAASRDLAGPLDEAFAFIPAPPTWHDPVPAFASRVFYGEPHRAIDPFVVLLLTVSIALVAAGWSTRGRGEEGAMADVLILALSAAMGLAAVVVNVILSPVDPSRVSIALSTVTRLTVLETVVFAVDTALHHRRRSAVVPDRPLDEVGVAEDQLGHLP